MKKVLAITLMLLLLATAAMAAENNWRITLKADNGAGMNGTSGIQVGVYPTSLDGYDAQDGAVAGSVAPSKWRNARPSAPVPAGRSEDRPDASSC